MGSITAHGVKISMNWPHLHLLTNHIPIFVTLSGVLVLGWALLRKEHLWGQTSHGNIFSSSLHCFL
jgi:hypothetical protein